MTYLNISNLFFYNFDKYRFTKCDICGMKLKEYSVQQKEIAPYMDFVVLATYCKRCKQMALKFENLPKKTKVRLK